jgi:membrane protein
MQKIKRVVKTMYDIFNKQRVTRSAAAMSYYLTISIFPFLIVVYAILTSLNISSESLYKVWQQIIPADVLSVILNYFHYVGGVKSGAILLVGIAVMLSSSSSAFGSLIKIMADIQGKSRFRGFWAVISGVLISAGLLAVMYVSGLVIVSGEWLLNFLGKTFGYADLLEIWQWVRFAILFLLLDVIIFMIYVVSAPKDVSKVRRFPGALTASVLLVVVSAVFSRLIGSAANYPFIYGSLASFIILMFWIYICSIILIMGNVLNYAIFHKEPELREFGTR